jgi:leader peptidase (prepilin peptidase)/N-methyltransferase
MVVIRFAYRVFRNQDGIGAGDVKLIAMLGGWLGVKAALLAFGLGVLLAAAYGLLVLANPTMRKDDRWQERKLPFGTFLALGGIVGGLWGVPLVGLYMRLTGM